MELYNQRNGNESSLLIRFWNKETPRCANFHKEPETPPDRHVNRTKDHVEYCNHDPFAQSFVYFLIISERLTNKSQHGFVNHRPSRSKD